MSSSFWALSRSFFIDRIHFNHVIYELDTLLCYGEPCEEDRSSCIEDAFLNFAFEVDTNADGSIYAIRYAGDTYTDEPDYEVFDVIASYVAAGSMIESGDDTGARQCWYFDGEFAHCYDAIIQYPLLPDPDHRILSARII